MLIFKEKHLPAWDIPLPFNVCRYRSTEFNSKSAIFLYARNWRLYRLTLLFFPSSLKHIILIECFFDKYCTKGD